MSVASFIKVSERTQDGARTAWFATAKPTYVVPLYVAELPEHGLCFSSITDLTKLDAIDDPLVDIGRLLTLIQRSTAFDRRPEHLRIRITDNSYGAAAVVAGLRRCG